MSTSARNLVNIVRITSRENRTPEQTTAVTDRILHHSCATFIWMECVCCYEDTFCVPSAEHEAKQHIQRQQNVSLCSMCIAIDFFNRLTTDCSFYRSFLFDLKYNVASYWH